MHSLDKGTHEIRVAVPPNTTMPEVCNWKLYKQEEVVSEGTAELTTNSYTCAVSFLFDGNYMLVLSLPETKLVSEILIESHGQHRESTASLDTFTLCNTARIQGSGGSLKVYKDETLIIEMAHQEEPFEVDITSISPSLDPLYLVQTTDTEFTDGSLYKVNVSIMQAMQEMKQSIDRLNTQYRLNALEFSDIDYLGWLRMGRDHFNSLGNPTQLTLTNAKGSIRHYWLTSAKYHAIKTRYLEEGMTSFDYSGSAVQLSVDITTYLETYAQGLEQELEKVLPLKKTLVNRGITSGDGSTTTGNPRNSVGAFGQSASLISRVPRSYY